MDMWLSYQPAFDFFLISLGFAYSQQIVLRAGCFSLATAAYAAVGAYTAAILVTRQGLDLFSAVVAATLAGAACAAVLAIPLARLRGIFQAIATIAFVEVLHALILYFEDLTGGATGYQNVPKITTTWNLLVAVALVVYVCSAIGRSGVGRAFDSIRQNETVAACLGVSVRSYQGTAFLISGAIGGMFGGLLALYSYSVDPAQFGFSLVIATLAAIVLGGRTSLAGPIIGTAVMALLPEISRPLADYRPLVTGLLLILMINYLPHGLGDSFMFYLRSLQAKRGEQAKEEVHSAGT